MICAFCNGFFGFKAGMTGGAIGASPGFCTYLLLSFTSAINMPFTNGRAVITTNLVEAGMLPSDPEEVLRHELGHVDWFEWNCFKLLIWGFGGRVASLVLFVLRNNVELAGAKRQLKVRLGAWWARKRGHGPGAEGESESGAPAA